MRITKITAYQFDAPVVEAEGARISGGRSFSGITTTVLEMETDQGLSGWGDKLILIGGIPTDFFVPGSATTGDLVRYLEYVKETVTPNGGYIPGITDAFSPLGDFDRLRIARDFFLGGV